GSSGNWQLGLLVAYSGWLGYEITSSLSVTGLADFLVFYICVAIGIGFIATALYRYLGMRRNTGFYAGAALAFLGAVLLWLDINGGGVHGTLWSIVTAGSAYSFVASAARRWFAIKLMSQVAERVTCVMVPPLFLIFLVLGTIFLGIATPTEGGAMGALGAFAMAMARRRLTFDLLKQALATTTKLSSFVVFILIGATVFGLTFQGVDGPRWVEHLLTGLPGGQTGFLIVVNILIFVLAFFLDFFELSLIVVPLLAPVAEKLGIDLVWFGVLLAVNMQTSFMHPPFGFAP